MPHPFGPQYDKVVSIFQGNSEPTAKDAVWGTKTTLKVGVIDNKTNRDGYANYVCEVLYDEGFRGKRITVTIIDIQKLVYKKKWVKLGQAFCK